MTNHTHKTDSQREFSNTKERMVRDLQVRRYQADDSRSVRDQQDGVAVATPQRGWEQWIQKTIWEKRLSVQW